MHNNLLLFVDVTIDYADLILMEIDAMQNELSASFGQPIVSERAQELMIEVLLMYQEIEMREEGIRIFLEMTDPANWHEAEQESLCWLQVARASAQDEFESDEPFSIPHSTHTYFDAYLNSVQNFMEGRDLSSYDLSACELE